MAHHIQVVILGIHHPLLVGAHVAEALGRAFFLFLAQVGELLLLILVLVLHAIHGELECQIIIFQLHALHWQLLGSIFLFALLRNLGGKVIRTEQHPFGAGCGIHHIPVLSLAGLKAIPETGGTFEIVGVNTQRESLLLVLVGCPCTGGIIFGQCLVLCHEAYW